MEGFPYLERLMSMNSENKMASQLYGLGLNASVVFY
jgi:hypothetical protein